MRLSLATSHLLLSLCLSSLIFFDSEHPRNQKQTERRGNKRTEGNQREMGRVFIGEGGMGVVWLARTESEYSSKRDPHLTLLQILSYPLVGAREEKGSLSLWGSWRRSQGRNSFQNLFCSAQWTGPFVWPYSDAVDHSNKERFQCTSL